MRNIIVKQGDIIYEIDYRVELLSIIQALIYEKNKIRHFGICEEDYYRQIIKRFGDYKQHPCIIKMREMMSKHHFYYDAPVDMFLQLSNHFKCENLNDCVFIERLHEDTTIYNLMDMLYKFSKEIHYDEFYESQKDFYIRCLNEFVQTVDKEHVTKFIIEYTGMAFKEKVCHIVIMPITNSHNYGIHHSKDVYACVCLPSQFLEKSQVYQADLSKLIVHEFLHSIINPITDQLQLIDEDDELFEEIKEIMAKEAYPTLLHIINEHIIRAITLRYLYFNFNDKYETALKNEIDQQFIYISTILDALVIYENNRNKYKTIEDFYEVIIMYMKEYYKEMRK